MAGAAQSEPARKDRLYQEIAKELFREFTGGNYDVGDKLPTERDLTQRYNVSRPTIREAMIALEVQGVIDVRVGSGAYLRQKKALPAQQAFDVSAFEVTEARLLVEGEAAALAAAEITQEELSRLDALIEEISRENARNAGTENADREFHMVVAKATRNEAIVQMVKHLWGMRSQSSETALLYAKARIANIKPVVDEHRKIVDALRSGDAAEARKAMQDHLGAVLDSLLFATEERAIEAARKERSTRQERYTRALG